MRLNQQRYLGGLLFLVVGLISQPGTIPAQDLDQERIAALNKEIKELKENIAYWKPKLEPIDQDWIFVPLTKKYLWSAWDVKSPEEVKAATSGFQDYWVRDTDGTYAVAVDIKGYELIFRNGYKDKGDEWINRNWRELQNDSNRIKRQLLERIKQAEETLAHREDELGILTKKPDSKQPVSAGEKQKLFDRLNAHANRVKWDGGYIGAVRAAIAAVRTLRQWHLASEYLDAMIQCTDGYWAYVNGAYLNDLRKQRDEARTHEERARLSLLIGDGMNKAAKDYKICSDIASSSFRTAWRETLAP